ncbi:MAG: hypothetical protein NTY07_00400 [Bacteroidia bacterium]|nr:hypothetical protein [Bacteroidia bacterium]
MKLLKAHGTILLFCIICFPLHSRAQSLPVGTPVLEDAYRRAQLLGQIDSTISFTVRPIFPVVSLKYKNVFDPTQTLDSEKASKSDGRLEYWNNRIILQLLPVTLQQQYNSDHPVGYNDGAMIPARGYQTMFSTGVYAKLGPLSIQLRPEYVYAENRNFQQFYKEQDDGVWYWYSELFNFIDLPERFGDKPYSKLFWGQSSLRLTFNPISLGISNENLWWGPGMRNSLLMSNTAAGFKHITLNTVRPIKTSIGSFEGQIIAGRLENSGFYPPDTIRSYIGYRLYIPKRDDWRYINGVVLSYQPKWVPGLFLGLTKSLSFYGEDIGTSLRDILPVLYPMSKKNNHGDELPSIAKDQRASIFIRWLLVKENAELYWEYGREDHAYNSRDLMLQLEYTRAYIFGLRKLYQLKAKTDQYIQINFELTQLEQTNTNPEHLWRYWYSNRDIRQGYTNEGQLIGAGIGPGSNLQSLSISWIKSLKTIGLQVERFVHNNDFHNIATKDIRGNWVDLSISLLGEWNYKNFLFSAKIECIKSLNYEDLYQPAFEDPNQFWIPGKDIFNFQGQISTSYRF